MKSITKKKRAHRALQIMQSHVGVSRTLNNWLTIINDELTTKVSLRSTKELAHMFRYISCVLDVKIEREKEMKSMGGSKICNTYYKLVKLNE